MKFPNLILIFLSVIILGSCKKGTPIDNTYPETTIAISQINLSGQNRLESIITLNWSGYDANGYIVAYEISFDGQTWQNVGDKEDSTFTFLLGQGQDSVDINFYVRAVANNGMVDPTPAYLKIPIKDTPPTVSISKPSSDTAYAVLSISWNATDIEGNQAIDSFYIKINSGKWFALSNQVNLVTFVPIDPTTSGAIAAKVYTNTTATLLSQQIQGLLLNDTNRVYVKAKDISGEYSNTDSTQAIYVKSKTSELLVIGADANIYRGVPSPFSVYTPILSSVYGNFDYIQMNITTGQNIPQYWNPTFTSYVSLYDKVFIYCDADSNKLQHQLLLELAASSFQVFLNKGGKLLISAPLPQALHSTSDLPQLLPLDSIPSVSAYGTPRVSAGALATPDSINAIGYPTLKALANLQQASPFYPQQTAYVMYNGQFNKGGRPVIPWQGPIVVCAKTVNQGGNTNLIYFSIELHTYDGDNNALQQLFSQIMKNDFNW